MDFKYTVNPVLQIDEYPIPNIDDIYSKVTWDWHYFTGLDFSDAYLQVPQDKGSQRLTTINTHRRLFYVYSVVFWHCFLTRSISRYYRIQLIQRIRKTVAYLDYILISEETMEEPNSNMRAVLNRLRDAGLRLSGDKCEFRSRRFHTGVIGLIPKRSTLLKRGLM